MKTAMLLLALALLLVGCGRKSWPQPAGPTDQIIYPRSYPAR